MSDLINKYIELRTQLYEELVRFHSQDLKFLGRQSPLITRELRRRLKKMRLTIQEMEKISQKRMFERQEEWAEAHPKTLGRNKR